MLRTKVDDKVESAEHKARKGREAKPYWEHGNA